MSECEDCHGPVVEVAPGLFKCMGVCENRYFRDTANGPHPKLNVVTTVNTLVAHEKGIETPPEEQGGLSSDMLIFVNRVAEGIVSAEGYTGEVAKQVKRTQDNIRRELCEVLDGKRDFNDWFNKTKTLFGLHPQNFLRLLSDSLNGLKSEEATELHEMYDAALRKRMFG